MTWYTDWDAVGRVSMLRNMNSGRILCALKGCELFFEDNSEEVMSFPSHPWLVSRISIGRELPGVGGFSAREALFADDEENYFVANWAVLWQDSLRKSQNSS